MKIFVSQQPYLNNSVKTSYRGLTHLTPTGGSARNVDPGSPWAESWQSLTNPAAAARRMLLITLIILRGVSRVMNEPMLSIALVFYFSPIFFFPRWGRQMHEHVHRMLMVNELESTEVLIYCNAGVTDAILSFLFGIDWISLGVKERMRIFEKIETWKDLNGIVSTDT